MVPVAIQQDKAAAVSYGPHRTQTTSEVVTTIQERVEPVQTG